MTVARFSVGGFLRASFLSIGASVFSYLTLVALARLLDQEAFAQYLYVLAWGMLAALITDCAADQCLVHFAKSNGLGIVDAWRKILPLKVLLLAVFSSLVFILNFLFGFDVPSGYLLLVVPAFYMGPIYEMGGRNVRYAAILFFEKVTFLLAGGAAALVGLNANDILMIYFAVSLVSLAVQMRSFRIGIRSIAGDGFASIGSYMGAYVPVYAVLVAQLFYGNVSRLIIEAKLGGMPFASASLALQIVNAVSLIQTQVDRHLRSSIISSVLDSDYRMLGRYIRLYSIWYVCPLVAITGVLIVFSDPLISAVFGKEWSEAGDALRLLAPLIVSIACLRLADMLVVALELGRQNLLVSLAAAASLAAALWWMPGEHGLSSYLVVLVGTQGLHVLVMGGLIYLRLRTSPAARVRPI